jgi:hypothetical protein
MTSKMAVLVCDTAVKAAEAVGFLMGHGYSTVTTSQVETFNYDAATYDGGTSDTAANKFVVIGQTSS